MRYVIQTRRNRSRLDQACEAGAITYDESCDAYRDAENNFVRESASFSVDGNTVTVKKYGFYVDDVRQITREDGVWLMPSGGLPWDELSITA